MRSQPPTDADFEAQRPYYEAELARGVERFLEPRRDTCAWCGSGQLSKRAEATDIMQGKPGTFVLERCSSCGYVFQNPRLTEEGLDFYYRDFYDGLGEHEWEAVFAAGVMGNVARAELVKAESAKLGTSPQRWLDVGTGHGYFGLHARDVLPGTVIDGLDMGVGVMIGKDLGWLDHAHLGMFPELAASIAGQYDVVSMHHYLEHTRDPRAELDAAATALSPGGLLLIEVPNPEYRLAKLFGRWWTPLFQPQHQQLVPMGNLVTALEERGFTIVTTQCGAAHIGIDAWMSVPRMLGVDIPDPRSPWFPKGSQPSRRKARGPFVSKLVRKGSRGLDLVVNVISIRRDNGNAYRVLARRG